LSAVTCGCSVKKFAINKLGDSLANGGTNFASDDDPDLVGEALPFSLKLMEGLLAESPKHRGLLFAAASGFTQYAYVFVQQPEEHLEDRNLEEADALKARARLLYLRARNYGLRGLETRYPGFEMRLRQNPKATVRKTTVRSGAIHNFLITYESVRVGASKDFASRSRKHFDRALELTSHQSASPYVALAEAVSVNNQDRQEFESLLKKALGVNPDARPEWRLSNIVMQRRAHWLLSREDELFVK
jgi:predicted anti-sigma-YlaC factor YlaD